MILSISIFKFIENIHYLYKLFIQIMNIYIILLHVNFFSEKFLEKIVRFEPILNNLFLASYFPHFIALCLV